MPKLILTIGVSGCGKSTWARAQKDHARVNKDDIRAMMFPPTKRDDPTALRPDESLVVSAQDAVIRQCMRKGINIIVDDTNLNPDHISRREKMIERHNISGGAYKPEDALHYTLETKVFDDSYNLELCKSRVLNRAANGGLDVPVEAIEAMHQKFLKLFPVKAIA